MLDLLAHTEHMYKKELQMIATLPETATLHWGRVPSTIGECIILATEAGVCWAGTPGTSVDEGIAWAKHALQVEHVIEGGRCPPLQIATEELRRYLQGERVQFSCPLDLHGTPFQISVWRELCHIPYGETRSYGEMARAIGRPSASRAVGAANGANPIAIIVPCHRVIGSNGKLVGYGGGLPTKEWLLALEGASLTKRKR
jgi:O-6-methylguanine DNA methyltransferase